MADRRAGDRPVTAPVVDWLTLADRGGDTFEGRNPPEGEPDRPGAGRVFGGLVVGQALVAAQRTVVEPDRGVHAVHASFLRAGRADRVLRYAVERTRDGGAFTSRRVVASQEGEPILVLVASFQADEPGPEYQPGPPLAPGGSEGAGSDRLPPPDGLPPGRYDGAAFDCRDVPVGAGPPGPAHVRRMWFRARGRLTDDPALHRAALAMASDHGPTRAVRQPHADHPGRGAAPLGQPRSLGVAAPAGQGGSVVAERAVARVDQCLPRLVPGDDQHDDGGAGGHRGPGGPASPARLGQTGA